MLPIIVWMINTIGNASTEASEDEETQDWKGFSLFLHLLLPLAGLAFLWGQRGIFARILLQLDRNCVSVYCPSLSKREKLLKWAGERLPSTWSSQAKTLSSGIPELWKDGSLLCTLINSVIPGACSNPHRHWKKPPLHAQALAYKYLELPPMFTDDELTSEFTISKEKNFINYLQQLQEAINNWPNKEDLLRKFTSQYVARGMGLYTGEQHRKTIFYIYSDSTTKKRNNVFMYIRGPYGTRGKTTISPFHNLKSIPVVNVLQDQFYATKEHPFKDEDQKSFLKTISLDFTSLISNAEEKNEAGEIPIHIDMEIDRAKITYIPNHSGIYEINLISDGELLKGSPFNVQIVQNSSEKRDSFTTQTAQQVKEKITFTKRKILSKVIDCVSEKINMINSPLAEETKSQDLIITAVTKNKDEILKTEINCSLEDIIEEINQVQGNTMNNALTEIKKIAEELQSESDLITETDFHVNSQYKLIDNCQEASTEIANCLHQNDFDEVDNESSPSNFLSDVTQTESTNFFNNIMNSSNKSSLLEKILPSEILPEKIVGEDDDDENNNAPLRRITSKIYLEISPKQNSFESQSVTSPICSDHIAPEVECSLNQMSLSEKRQLLTKQDSIGSDSVFSFSENNSTSRFKDSDLEELSLLNVLDSLKQSRSNSLTEPYSLTSTFSLPNMASLESTHETTFKARKHYWERLSSRSSSSVSLAHSDFKSSSKKAFTAYRFNFNTTKSADNLSVIDSREITSHSYKSIDNSLDDCTRISLEERKKNLLKDLYDKEKRQLQPKKLSKSLKYFQKTESLPKPMFSSFFTPIAERIKAFDKNSTSVKLSPTPPQNIDLETAKTETLKSEKSTDKFKTQYKKAIKFFKKLDDNYKLQHNNIKRSLSFDYEKKEIFKRKGGSLNLMNISDKFSINNLYNDVFGGKRGSFKGTVNNSGVAKSLASLSTAENSEDSKVEDSEEDNLSYNIFVTKSKNKKRKSIRGLFNINY